MRSSAAPSAEQTMMLFVDVLPEIVPGNRTQPDAKFRQAIEIAMRGATLLALPTVASVVPLRPDVPAEAIAELAAAKLIVRDSVAVFDHAATREELGATGRSVVAIGGISSEVGVLHAVSSARRNGLDVHVLVDACGGLDSRSERAAFEQMASAGATMSSTASFFSMLTVSFVDDRARGIFAALSPLWS